LIIIINRYNDTNEVNRLYNTIFFIQPFYLYHYLYQYGLLIIMKINNDECCSYCFIDSDDVFLMYISIVDRWYNKYYIAINK